MPKGTPGRTCKDCGAREDDEVRISTRRLCEPCALGRMQANMVHLHNRTGAYWRNRTAGYVRYIERLQGNSVKRSGSRGRRRSAA